MIDAPDYTPELVLDEVVGIPESHVAIYVPHIGSL
jgi:hypothetical protein